MVPCCVLYNVSCVREGVRVALQLSVPKVGQASRVPIPAHAVAFAFVQRKVMRTSLLPPTNTSKAE